MPLGAVRQLTARPTQSLTKAAPNRPLIQPTTAAGCSAGGSCGRRRMPPWPPSSTSRWVKSLRTRGRPRTPRFAARECGAPRRRRSGQRGASACSATCVRQRLRRRTLCLRPAMRSLLVLARRDRPFLSWHVWAPCRAAARCEQALSNPAASADTFAEAGAGYPPLTPCGAAHGCPGSCGCPGMCGCRGLRAAPAAPVPSARAAAAHPVRRPTAPRRERHRVSGSDAGDAGGSSRTSHCSPALRESGDGCRAARLWRLRGESHRGH